ncbi:MAG: 30S ribosomal protein S16 [Candidatus Wolfebacteria bacterium]|nr:30S ribosomal protein S16 [Candidatus Wolfebacteria bacterium]MDP2704090.1 30S ribosomal protein S16 [bacterium]
MLTLKFKKTGKKHQSYLRLIAIEKKAKLNGKNTDDLGWANPHAKTHEIDKEKVLDWLKKGAQPSDTVHNFLIKLGLIKGKKKAVHSQKTKEEEKVETPTKPQAQEEAAKIDTAEEKQTEPEKTEV